MHTYLSSAPKGSRCACGRPAELLLRSEGVPDVPHCEQCAPDLPFAPRSVLHVHETQCCPTPPAMRILEDRR